MGLEVKTGRVGKREKKARGKNSVPVNLQKGRGNTRGNGKGNTRKSRFGFLFYRPRGARKRTFPTPLTQKSYLSLQKSNAEERQSWSVLQPGVQHKHDV